MRNRRVLLGVAATTLASAVSVAAPGLVSRWSFDAGGANAVAGAPAGVVERAVAAEGHAGGALAFEDWAARGYLRPDPRAATRVVIPHDARLNPPYPFRVSVWIRPTAAPLFFGGIVEKGTGRGASYRLLLMRDLRVEAALGGGHATVRSGTPLSLNAWHEVALAADGKTLTLLIDGAQAGRLDLASPPPLVSTDPIVIGERFTGVIDEVEIRTE